MLYQDKKSIWQILSLSGAIGVVIYILHVIIGGYLWTGYSHITQTISELTAIGAPNAAFLRLFTTGYGICLLLFSFCLYVIFKSWKVSRIAIVGAILLIVMEIFSFIGYALFPLDPAVSVMDIQNIMHIVVTAIVIICTIGASYCIGIGLIKTGYFKRIGVLVFTCAIIITASGILTPIAMANQLLISGLTERITIFSLLTWIFVLSIYTFSKKRPYMPNKLNGLFRIH